MTMESRLLELESQIAAQRLVSFAMFEVLAAIATPQAETAIELLQRTHRQLAGTTSDPTADALARALDVNLLLLSRSDTFSSAADLAREVLERARRPSGRS